VALTTRPSDDWFHPSPRSICSTKGPARWDFGAPGWPAVALLWPQSGACLARAALASSTSHSPGSSPCGFTRSHSTLAVRAGYSIHRIDGSLHKLRNGVLNRSCAAYVQSARSACIVMGILGVTYNSTDTRKPQSLVTDRTFDTSGPRHWYNEVGVVGRSFAVSYSWRPDRSCVTPWIRMIRDSSFSRTTLRGIPLPGVAHSGFPVAWRCGNSHPPSHRGTAVRWPRHGTRRRLMGRPSTSRPLVGLSGHQGRTLANGLGKHGCCEHLK